MIIKGNTVGTTTPRTDFNQTDPNKADYLKGREDLLAAVFPKTGGSVSGPVSCKPENGTDMVTVETYRNLPVSDPTESYKVRLAIEAEGAVIQAYKGNLGEEPSTEINRLTLAEGETLLGKPLSVKSGGTGANNAAEARANLGAAPAGDYATKTYVSSKFVSKDGGTLSGGLTVEAQPSGGQGYIIQKTVNSVTEKFQFYINTSGLPSVSFYENGKEANRMVLNRDSTKFIKPVDISSGGTGATTAKQALENLGAMSQTLLWENASRTSSFSHQMLNMEIPVYDEYLIYFCLNASEQNNWIISGRCPVGETLVCNFVWADDGIKYHRSVETSQGGFSFGDGYRQGVVDGTACIPLKIYGIKGVSK